MILPPTLPWGSVLRAMAPQLVSVAALSVSAVLLDLKYGQRWVELPGLPLAVIGSSLGIFLGFRNNSAYDRWWEARNLWGGMVNECRTLVRRSFEFGGAALRESAARHAAAFAHAARWRLRGGDSGSDLRRILGDEGDQLAGRRNPPIAVLESFGDECRAAFVRGEIGEIRLTALEESLSTLTNLYGGCERIKNTPMILLYDAIPQAMVYVVMILVPFALVHDLGWFTPAGALMVSFLFLSLDMIGRTVESPFEGNANDVPITAIATTIEADAFEAAGLSPVPEAMKPVNGCLL